MKKLVLVIAAVFAAAVMISSATATGGPLAESRGFACGVIDGDGSFTSTTNSYAVWYASGATYLRCEKQGSNSTGQVVKFNYENTGILCGVPISGATDEWNNRVGRNGAIQLTCNGHLNPGDINGDSASSGAGVG